MTRSRDQLHLRYIVESIGLIERYTADGLEAFERDRLIQDGVLRRLETLADAANKLPQTLKDRYPDIRWHALRGFRNVAAHAYTSVRLDIVWGIVVTSLPPLKVAAEQELRAIGREPEREG